MLACCCNHKGQIFVYSMPFPCLHYLVTAAATGVYAQACLSHAAHQLTHLLLSLHHHSHAADANMTLQTMQAITRVTVMPGNCAVLIVPQTAWPCICPDLCTQAAVQLCHDVMGHPRSWIGKTDQSLRPQRNPVQSHFTTHILFASIYNQGCQGHRDGF